MPKSSFFAVLCLSIALFALTSSGQIPINDFDPITENFDSMSSGSELPPNWIVSAPGTNPNWNDPTSSTLLSYSRISTEAIPSAALSVNWTCLNCGTDRSPGFMTQLPQGSQPGTNALIAHYKNLTGSTLRFARLRYSVKQFQISNQTVSVVVSWSKDGTTWITNGNFLTISNGSGPGKLPTDLNSHYLDTPNSASAPYNVPTPWFDLITEDIPMNGDLYVRWTFTQSISSVAQGVGLDDVMLQAYRSDPTCREITTTNTVMSENFDSLGISTYNDTLPEGFGYFARGTRAFSYYTPSTGTNNAGALYSLGSSDATDRAFGMLRSGSFEGTLGGCFKNITGRPITSILVKYDGERWRSGANGRSDKLLFAYSTDATDMSTGTWTPVTSLDFTTTPTASGDTNGNLPAHRVPEITATIESLNIPNGSNFYIRWVDVDVTGIDDALAIDNFELTAFVPTAAGVSVSGRVAEWNGLPIRGAVVTIGGGDLSAARTFRTGTFGQYSFESLPAGGTYFISVRAAKRSFASPTRVVNLDDSIVGVDFIAVSEAAKARRR